MTIWVTKYALTSGIQRLDDARACGETARHSVAIPYHFGERYLHRNEWYMTEKAAKVEAEKMRKKKIVSLRKQLAKMEALKF